ncbi:hypothetical protein [Streptomyces sp. NPDC048845]
MLSIGTIALVFGVVFLAELPDKTVRQCRSSARSAVGGAARCAPR